MDHYLFPDIVYNIVKYLDKIGSFNLVNISKYTVIGKSILYNRFVFDNQKITNNHLKKIKHIKNLKISNYDDLSWLDDYKNICGIHDKCEFDLIKHSGMHYLKFKNILVRDNYKTHMFHNLVTLGIYYKTFNQPLNNLFNTLTSLVVYSDTFNQPIDCLPINLKSFHIYSNVFNQPLNNLPNNLKSLDIYSEPFNQPINNLPDKLETLNIWSWKFIQPIDIFPKSLKMLVINEIQYK